MLGLEPNRYGLVLVHYRFFSPDKYVFVYGEVKPKPNMNIGLEQRYKWGIGQRIFDPKTGKESIYVPAFGLAMSSDNVSDIDGILRIEKIPK